MRKTFQRLERAVEEGRILLSRHDGIHNMHGAFCNLTSWLKLAKEEGLRFVDWNNVELMLTKMRITDKTGEYPKE